LPEIIDTQLALSRKRRALARAVPDAAFLVRRVAEDLADRLSTLKRTFEHAVTLFSVTDDAQAAIVRSGTATAAMRVEADSAFLKGVNGLLASPETVPFPPESLDLAVSLLSLQEANDIPGMLIQIRRALRPDGLFIGAMAGSGTLAELRESLLAAESEIYGGASPRVIPFADVRDAGALLQRAGFALPVADVETITVRYDDMFKLMRDLRAMGVTNALAARTRRPATRALFMRAAQIYGDRFADPDGRIRATFAIAWMSGWAPAPTQQKPLQPGSAKVSLAEFLQRDDPTSS
jgi:SAM-dependent methyltransferase